MTMVSFRVDDDLSRSMEEWSRRLGIERSVLLRDALRRHLDRLAGEADADRWEKSPMTDEERSLADIADWGVAEDWSDWADSDTAR